MLSESLHVAGWSWLVERGEVEEKQRKKKGGGGEFSHGEGERFE